MIYAQYYLMAQGLAVTWDNPDITLFDGGVPVPVSPILPDHAYEVRVRVWNGSYSAPAVGVKVTLSQLSFGIGTLSVPVGEAVVDLGVKGTPDHPAFTYFTWRTPAEPGHYCLQAHLHWHDDANPDNNLGQDNVMVGVAASPARFTFTLRNTAAVRRHFVFEADSYRPDSRPCDPEYEQQFADRERTPTRIAESRARWEWARRTQAYGMFPIPRGWSVRITPADTVLDSGEETIVEVVIEPDDPDFSGTATFNVHGFALGPGEARELVGGVTLKVATT
ncbi:hypothetical protein ACIHCM_35315 [Streptomyces sp. NPDC052023]|uniref:hypothetical protein n=1 Tax=Streptomyces sp. NPDC052023 TaxID=3365681 RepID=UPI0037D37AB8